MSTRRKLAFPLCVLVGAAEGLESAIADSASKPAMDERLTTAFHGKIQALTGDAAAQSSQTGDIAELTLQQRQDFNEMERLAAGARRSAKLAFPGQSALLRAEFMVGGDDLYHDCLVIQNAARLQYPAQTDAYGNAQNVTPRARFLLDESPRDRSQPDGGTQGGDSTPPPPAPPAA